MQSYTFINRLGKPTTVLQNGTRITITVGDKNWETTIEEISALRVKEWQESGRYIQDVLPAASDDTREFLMTGTLPDEWDTLFSEEQQEDDWPLEGDDDEPPC